MLRFIKFKTILPILFSLIAISSCKKYEEGPVTLRTPKARLTDKIWVLADIKELGISQPLSESDKGFINFEDDGKFFYSTNATEFGTWEFSDKKDKFKITIWSIDKYLTVEYTIKKLTNSELIYKLEGPGYSHEYSYKKKD